MREIEFRSQRVDNEEWVYGMPLESKFNCTYMLTKQGGLNADFIYSRYTILDSKDSIVVKTETIGVFTGVLDKNVNKIFEGDKVKAFGSIYEVIFNDGAFYLRKENSHLRLSRTIQDLEIIGNIHENQ